MNTNMRKVNPQSQMNYMQPNMANFSNAFMPNQTFIDKPDFSNKGGTIHNNLGDKLLSEYISEYKIHINTKDRNISTHPSPFKTKVQFGDTLNQFTIGKRFKNIKYITLDSVILPRTNAVDVSKISEPNIYPSGSIYTDGILNGPNVLSNLSKRRNLTLKIEELDSDKNLGTSLYIDKNTFILAEECHMGIDSHLWKPIHSTIIFPNSLLCNVSSLTLSILDEYGNELKLTDQSGNLIIGTNLTGSSGDYNKFISDNSYVESVIYTNNIIQAQFNFTFGVVDNELNTSTSF